MLPASRTAPPAAISSYAGCSIDVARDGSLMFRFQDPAGDTGVPDRAAGAEQHPAEALEEPAVHVPVDAAEAASGAAHSAAETAGEAATVLQVQLLHRCDSHAHASSSSSASSNGHSRPATHANAAGAATAAEADALQTGTAPRPLRRLGLDARTGDTMSLLGAFSDLANQGALGDALAVTEALVAAKRKEVLSRCASAAEESAIDSHMHGRVPQTPCLTLSCTTL